VWIVDPIDGTGNFAAGHAPFGLMIALAVDGDVKAGWMFDPLDDRMCHARAGEGAFIDGARIAARGTGQVPPVVGISLVFMDQAKRQRIKDKAEGHLTMVDIPRCAAEQYPRIVLGVNDMALFERTLPWDHAPGVLFVNEAGGKAARADGSPYLVTDRGTGLLAAASPALWDQGAAILF
jgi:fructose-1,6-bisphosphatase/inositol monophosphatase family enzyme